MDGIALSQEDIDRIACSSGWRQRRIEVFDTAAGKVLVKGQRGRRSQLLYRLLNAAAQVIGLPCLKAVPMHGGARAQQIEVARLRALHQAGVRVPRVLYVAPDYFVMQWLGGEQLGTLLQAKPPVPAALAVWREAGDMLVRLHACGQYLSQCFARNLIVDTARQPPRLAGAIDFEDDALEVMNLAEAQTRDWLDFLHSTLWMVPLPPAQIDAQLDAWMEQENQAVRGQLLQTARKVGWLRHLPRWRCLGRDTLALQGCAAATYRFAMGRDARGRVRARRDTPRTDRGGEENSTDKVAPAPEVSLRAAKTPPDGT